MLDDLLKTLPPRREVDHNIELELVHLHMHLIAWIHPIEVLRK